jgi:hypothetical protein
VCSMYEIMGITKLSFENVLNNFCYLMAARVIRRQSLISRVHII